MKNYVNLIHIQIIQMTATKSQPQIRTKLPWLKYNYYGNWASKLWTLLTLRFTVSARRTKIIL